jgi:prepilin-type N-terminal cleavage/methylation domain-containing protein
MPNKLSKVGKIERGFTLVEVMISLLISAIIIAAIVSLATTSMKAFRQAKEVSEVKELGKSGMAQLEWLFQRWGTATPCDNTNTSLCTSVSQDCLVSGSYAYPPPSTACITIADYSTYDEAHFYANLTGSGFVHIPQISDPSTMNIKSCRLSTASGQNCYYVKMGAKFITDKTNTNVYKPLIFSLSNLSDNNLVCTDGTIIPNATISVNATALNGQLKDDAGNFISTYQFEGGEIVFRVPHRVRLFCQDNPSDQNRKWLYMEATDMATGCHADEPAQPLIPVNSFDIKRQGEGIVVTMQVRGTDGKTTDIQRNFAR